MEHLKKYEVRKTGKSPFDGCDIAVYQGDQFIRGFNSLSDDWAFTNAREYADERNIAQCIIERTKDGNIKRMVN